MKALVVRNGLLGDTVQATAVISPLRAAGYARVDWLSNERMQRIKEWIPQCGDIFILGQKRAIPFQCRLLCAIRKERYDLLLILEESSRYWSLAWLCGAKKVAGLHRHWYAKAGMDHALATDKKKSVVWNYHRLVCSFLPGTAPALPVLVPPRAWASPDLERFLQGKNREHVNIVVHPGSSNTSFRSWPGDYWKKLIEALLCQQNVGVTLSVAGSEAQPFRGLDAAAGSSRIRFAGDFNLADLCGLIYSCDLFISADTGPMHIAAALRKPQVALFGPTDAGISGPDNSRALRIESPYPCRSCAPDTSKIKRMLACARNRKPLCLEAITPERVITEMKNKWGTGNLILAKEKLHV